jgi:hypothetical protein
MKLGILKKRKSANENQLAGDFFNMPMRGFHQMPLKI